MRKIILATALASAVSLPSLANAQAAPAAEPASPHTFTGNLTLASSYRFRGIDQTFGKPAIQGGFDYSHASGLYLGNWNSNVSSGAGYPDGNLEMDFYGGWKTTFGDFGLDVGALYYYYPGTTATPFGNSGKVNNQEVYIGGSWKFISLKYSHSIDDYFSIKGPGGADTKNSNYIDLSASYDLGGGWGINGHVGHLKFKNVPNGDYTDWKVGVTKDISGYVFGLAYVDTNAHGDCGKGEFYCFSNTNSDQGGGLIGLGTKFKDAGRSIAVVSVSKTF